MLEASRREHRVAFERDDQRAGACEFLAEPFVVLIERVGLRKPGGEVVVDALDLRERGDQERAQEADQAERIAEAIEELTQADAVAGGTPARGRGVRGGIGSITAAHFAPRSSSRRLKSLSLRPTL